MPSLRLEDLTPFGRLALKLDQEFAQLASAGAKMEKVDVESDNGLDEGIKILNRVAQHGQAIAETMREFATALNEARDKAEAATKTVAQRGEKIKARKQRQDELQGKLAHVKDGVKAAGEGLAGVAKAVKKDMTEDDRRRVADELSRVQAPMAAFIEAVKAIKAQAAGENFRRLEREAAAMIDTLEASRRKIERSIGPK
jgi:hypothetical protein